MLFRSPKRTAALHLDGMGLVTQFISFTRRLTGRLPYDPQITNLEHALLTCGLTEPALNELSTVAVCAQNPDTQTSAALLLARWHMRPQSQSDPATALRWVKAAQKTARARAQRRHLFTLEILCLDRLGARDQAKQVVQHALAAGDGMADLMLASANLEAEDKDRIWWINQALAAYKIPAIDVSETLLGPRFDRLICASQPYVQANGPTVSVIIAAYEAEATLPTALRSLQAQTWRKLEILVVDDASPSASTTRIAREFAAKDPRIKLIEMRENSGAYVARNRALDLASGEYVTLQDADDWSHPSRIEMQVDFLQRRKSVLACTSEQARATDDLSFERWIGAGRAIVTNYASLMFRREAMRTHFGYWDTVRLSADNELIRRMRTAFGQRSVRFLPTGPLAFQRFSHSNMTSDPVLGISGTLYGARQEYFEAQTLAHRGDRSLRYDNDLSVRPFPAPGIMCPDRVHIAAQKNNFDIIVATDFRCPDQITQDALEDIKASQNKGLRVAAFTLYRYHVDAKNVQPIAMSTAIRQWLWDHGTRILCFGEVACCETLLIYDPATITYSQRYLPRIHAESVALITRSVSEGLSAAMATIQQSFDTPACCYPFDEAARQSICALDCKIESPKLAAQNWERERRKLGQNT